MSIISALPRLLSDRTSTGNSKRSHKGCPSCSYRCISPDVAAGKDQSRPQSNKQQRQNESHPLTTFFALHIVMNHKTLNLDAVLVLIDKRVDDSLAGSGDCLFEFF